MAGDRIRAKEVTADLRRLARLRLVEGRRIDHRDVVEGTRDRAVAASDAHDRTESRFRPSGRRLTAPVGQAFMHLGSSQWRQALGTRYLPIWTPLRISRLRPCSDSQALHAVVALDAQVEVHHQQRVGLDHAELAAFLEQVGQLRGDGAFLLLRRAITSRIALLSLRVAPAQREEVLAVDLDQLALAGGQHAGPRRRPPPTTPSRRNIRLRAGRRARVAARRSARGRFARSRRE